MQIKKSMVSILLILVLSLFFCGCSQKVRPKILLVIDEGTDDYSYYVENTKKICEEKCSEYDFTLELLEIPKGTDYEASLTKALIDEPELVIFSSPSLETYAVIEAKNHPNINFLLIDADADINLDGFQDVQNIYSMHFNRNESGFLSGIYAALKSPQRICFIGKEEFIANVEYESGFVCGVLCINPEITVDKLYLGLETDESVIETRIREFIGTDCDIIYTLYPSDIIYKVAEELNISVIGTKYNYTEGNEYGMSFCAEHDINSALCYVIDEFYNGTFKGKIQSFGLNGNFIIPLYINENEEYKDTIAQWVQKVIEENIMIPKTRADSSYFVPFGL